MSGHPISGRRTALTILAIAAIVGLTYAVAAGSSPSTPAEAGEWRPIAEAPLAPREGHTAIWTGTEMIVWGGQTVPDSFCRSVDAGETSAAVECTTSDDGIGPPFEQHADGAAYDPDTDTWRTIPEAPFEGRVFHRAAWTGSEMIVWGGSNGFVPEVLGAAFDPSTDTWRALPHVEVGGSLHPELLWDGTHLWLFAGDPFPTTAQISVARYDPGQDRWTWIGSIDLDTVHDALRVDDTIYVAGERRVDDAQLETVVWAIGPDEPARFVGLLEGTVTLAVDDDRVLAFTSPNTVYAIDDDTEQLGSQRFLAIDDWGEEEELTPVALAPGELLIYGRHGAHVGEVGEDWAHSEPPGEAARRYHHTVVWTGDELILWGGRSGENAGPSVATGYAFTPSVDG
ncbi:MAG: hypothetical protein AAGA90_22190 [Actinomycetota bacterium]